jgi:hypothetical protein
MKKLLIVLSLFLVSCDENKVTISTEEYNMLKTGKVPEYPKKNHNWKSSGDWISVNERYPDDVELKLVWFAKATHFPDITVGRHQLAWWDGERWGNTKSDDIENNPDYMVVTHWKVLDEPKII